MRVGALQDAVEPLRWAMVGELVERRAAQHRLEPGGALDPDVIDADPRVQRPATGVDLDLLEGADGVDHGRDRGLLLDEHRAVQLHQRAAPELDLGLRQADVEAVDVGLEGQLGRDQVVQQPVVDPDRHVARRQQRLAPLESADRLAQAFHLVLQQDPLRAQLAAALEAVPAAHPGRSQASMSKNNTATDTNPTLNGSRLRSPLMNW